MSKQNKYVKCRHGKTEIENFSVDQQAKRTKLGVNPVRCENCNTWFYHPDVVLKTKKTK